MKNTVKKLVLSLAATVVITGVNAATWQAKQIHFATPQRAVSELMAAVKANDKSKITEILGVESKPLLESGDPAEDKATLARFAKAYDEANKIEKKDEETCMLDVGKDDWTFPIPIVKEAKGWYFDTEEGKQEVLNRRIGRNELSTMQTMLAYVDAQQEYHQKNPMKESQAVYAQKFASRQDKHDGLFYPVKPGQPLSPLGEAFIANESGYPLYHGYHFRILKAQGAAAAGGAKNYVLKDKMTGGFAAVAWPATYDNSGVMTFIVNQDGVVYEKDLGDETDQIAKKMTQYNPDQTWKKSKVEAVDTDA